jgi:hypothetical protein
MKIAKKILTSFIAVLTLASCGSKTEYQKNSKNEYKIELKEKSLSVKKNNTSWNIKVDPKYYELIENNIESVYIQGVKNLNFTFRYFNKNTKERFSPDAAEEGIVSYTDSSYFTNSITNTFFRR